MTINFKLVKKFFNGIIGNLSELKTSNKSNVVEAINSLKTSDLENDSGFLNKCFQNLDFSNLDEFKNYLRSASVNSASVSLFYVNINGAGFGAIVQKTTNLYLSALLFSYTSNPVCLKLSNGTWTEVEL